jgi:FMN phosphatase YigB (HAD superfamily)
MGMHNYSTWLLDLDDTLQVGPLSWASIHLFPDIIAQTGIKPDKATFDAAIRRAHELYDAGNDNDVMGDEFFRQMGWSTSLKNEVIGRFFREYRPGLFDDTLPFLEWAAGQGHRLYVTANNVQARQICQSLGISRYFADILTPADCGVARKPDAGMWEYLKARTDVTGDSTVVVGNELMFDAGFAKNCGLDCMIVDRYDRFDAMPERCVRVASLTEIAGQTG